MSTGMTTSPLEDQVRALRRWTLALGILCGVLAVGVAILSGVVVRSTESDSKSLPSVLRAKSMQIVNAAGRTVAEVKSDPGGGGALLLRNSQGEEVVVLGTPNGSGFIAALDRDQSTSAAIEMTDLGMRVRASRGGSAVAVLGSDAGGRGTVKVSASGGPAGAVLAGSQRGGSLMFMDGSGRGCGIDSPPSDTGTRGLRYVDDGGTAFATLSKLSSGSSALLLGGKGGPAAILAAADEGGYLTVFGRTGKEVARVGTDSVGGGVLSVQSAAGVASAEVGFGGVRVYNRRGAAVAALLSDSDQDGSLHLANALGREVVGAGVSANSRGGLIFLNDESGLARCSLEARKSSGWLGLGDPRVGGRVHLYGDMDGGGALHIESPTGRLPVTLGCDSTGAGRIILNNGSGNTAAALILGDDDAGHIWVNDRRGNTTWSTP